MKSQPKINQMIAFITKVQPNVIDDIRTENPEFSEILKLGVTLGNSDQPNELKVRAKVCAEALELISKSCGEELIRLKSKLKSVQKIQFAGQILAAIGSASVIISLTKSFKMEYTLVPGIISLVGSIIPFVADFKGKGVSTTKKLDEIYTELTQVYIEAGSNLKELRFFTIHGFNEDGITEIITNSNQLAAKIYGLLYMT